MNHPAATNTPLQPPLSGLRQISVGALNQQAGDLKNNAERIIEAIHLSRQAGSHILCLGELSVTGYGCEDLFFSHDFLSTVEHTVAQICHHCRHIGVFIGAPMTIEEQLYNTVIHIVDQKVVGIHAKKELARSGVHYEPRWFTPWPHGHRTVHHYAGEKAIPTGDICYRLEGPHVDGLGIGIEICEEAWVTPRSLLPVAHQLHLIFNPSASHFALNKHNTRKQLITASSTLFNTHYLYANLLGMDAGHIIYDGSLLWAWNGHIQMEAPILTSHPISLMHVPLPPLSFTPPTNPPPTPPCIPPPSPPQPQFISLSWPLTNTSACASSFLPPDLPSDHHRDLIMHTTPGTSTAASLSANKEFFHSVCLGLYDYLRRSRAHGFVIALSGGCDSAVMATLVSGMIRKGMRELGAQTFLRSIGRQDLIPSPPASPTPDHTHAAPIIASLLSCIYLASANSSTHTHHTAGALARELGATFYTHDIQHIIKHYTDDFAKIYKRPLSWHTDALLLQNIQARCRAPMAWMLANAMNAILLCTANRSEGSLGYFSMDGDSAGGIAPLAGVSKDFLLQWASWAHTVGCPDLADQGPTVQAFKDVLAQKPTAELCPPTWNQSDETDLMPYPIIATLEHWKVAESKNLFLHIQDLKKLYPAYDTPTLEKYVHTFERLWHGSQWKRERLAMGFHIADFNISPKSGCRYPILCTPQPPNHHTKGT